MVCGKKLCDNVLQIGFIFEVPTHTHDKSLSQSRGEFVFRLGVQLGANKVWHIEICPRPPQFL